MLGKKSMVSRVAMVAASIVLALCAFGAPFAFADRGPQEGDWFYRIDNNTACIEYYGSKSKLTVPNKVAGKKVAEAYICSSNIKIVDVSKAKSLIRLTVTESPKLSSVNFEKAKKLQYISIGSDKMKKIDFSKNKKLKYIYVGGKNFTSINTTKNKSLIELSVSCPKLKKINLSQNKKLQFLGLGRCSPKINFAKLTKLKRLNVWNTKLKSIDISKNKALEIVTLSENKKLSKVTFPASAPNLKLVDIKKNSQLKNIKLPASAPKLNDLIVSNNKLGSLKVTPFTNLGILYLDGNQVKALDVSKNTKLTYLNIAFNPGLSVNVEGLPINLQLGYSPAGKLVSMNLSNYDYWTTPTLPSLEFKNK